MARSYAPRDKEAQKVADAEQAPDAAKERAEALQSLKGNADAIDAMAHAAEMAGPAATAPTLLEFATDYLRELEGVGEESGDQGEEGGGYAQEEGGGGPPADEEPPADPEDVAERVEEMVEEGPPPESDEPGGPPAMRDAAGGGPPDPDAVRPLLDGSTAQPLPEATASRLGSVLDHDMSHVMIHIDGKAAEAADALHANAFALGTHVFFGGGRYQPGTPGGDMLLLHELTHVMQYDHKQLRESTTGAMEVSAPGEAAESEARTAAFHGLTALRAADRDGDEARVLGDRVHPIGRGMRPENQPMRHFPREALPDKGVIFREEDLATGEDEGWVIAKVRDYSPELADVLTEGFEATMGTDLLTAASDWIGSVAPELDLDGMLVELTTSLTEGASLLLGAVQGDMLCCERITDIAEALSTSLDQLLGANGLMEALEDEMTATGKFLAGLGATLVDGALDLVATLADTIGLTALFDLIDGFVGWLGAGAAALADKALVALGLPTLAELPGLLADQAAEVMATAYAGLQAVVDEVAIYLASFDIVAALAEVGEHLTEAAAAVSWLAEHWGEPDLWETHGAEVAEQFTRFGGAMELAIAGWAGVQSWMVSGSELWGQVQSTAKGLVTSPLFGWLFLVPGFNLLLSPILLVAVAGEPLWGELASALEAVGSWVMWATEILMEVGTVISGMANPVTAMPMIVGLLLGSFTLLPECYQAPVLDTLILLGAVASGILTFPLLALGPLPTMVYQAVVSFWDTLADKSVQEKATLLGALAAMLRMSFVPDLLAGLVVGVVKGLWDEVVGIITLIVGGLALVVGSAGALLSLLPLLAKALSDYAEGAKERRDAEAGAPGQEEGVDDIADELDPGVAPIEEGDLDPGEVDTAPPTSYDSLREALGGAWQALEDSADWAGAKLADGMVAIIEGAESGAYTLGEWVGWGAVMFFAGGLFGKGAKMLADAFPLLARIIDDLAKAAAGAGQALDKVLGPLRTLAGMAGDAFDAILDGLKAIPLPFVTPLIAGIARAKERLLHWLGVLLAKLTKKLDDLKKKKKQPDADQPGGDPKKPEPNAPGKPKDGADPKKKKPDGEEDESLRKEAELRAQRIWPTLDADTLQTRTDWNRDLAKKDSRPTAGVRFSHEVDLDANRWQLMVTAKEGIRWGRATAGKGWRASVDADDTVHEREAWLGKVDKSAANKQVLQASAPDLEAAWNDAWWSDGDLDAVMKKAMAQEDGELDRASYDETDLFLDVGDLQMSKVSGRLVASPNSQATDVDMKVEPLNSKEYKAAFERAAPAAFDKHMREPWAQRIEQEIDGFDWSDVPDYEACRADGFDRATKAINEWFQKKARRRSVPWDERLERELLTVEEHRGALFGPVLEAGAEHLKQLLAGQDDILETIEVDHAAAVLYVGQATGVAQILVDAVKESGSDNQAIVDFLLKLGGGGRTSNGVSSREFGDKGAVPHKASWYATDGGGYLANRKWVKDKFRKADDEKHEWVPSDMIEEMVDRDVSAADATTTAEWIETQHQMRSPTEAILFWPEANMELQDRWEDALDADEDANPQVFIETWKVSSVTFDLQGHSGALYVRENDKKVPQTKGQGEFHDHLRRLVRASDTPQGYRSQLTDFLKKEKGIWNGNIDFLPNEWDEPEHKAIRTTHEGKNNKPLGGNLFLVGKSVYSAFQAVLKVVEG